MIEKAIAIVPATLAHARAIDLRDGDRREIAAVGKTAEQAVADSLARSLWAESYMIGGEVAAIVGLAVPCVLGGIACPWLLTGRPVDRHTRTFLRETAKGVARMQAEYPVLLNMVHAEYRQALRWLGWLGFEIGPPRPHGPYGAPFCPAILKPETCHG